MSNRNRHKNKRKPEKIRTKSTYSPNTLGEMFKFQGINLDELKKKINGNKKETYKKAI